MSDMIETSSNLHKVESQTVSFGEGLLQGAVQQPYNAAAELANHAAQVHLPEMHIVDESKASTASGIAGAMAGTFVDVAALNGVTALAGAAVAGAAPEITAASAAVAMGVYFGVFSQSDVNSKHMIQDRVTAGAIGAAEGALIGGLAKFIIR
jgi:hypothetical protein